ncbi:glycerophosphodiester phosphodiesterase [Nostoc sp. CALU 546]|uniref:glycerophosphodiester phosphodiesterase n=1 Tax=Nostoc sp. CALU 546 TaxID=1867241 RepID=UPI003B6707E0
MNKFLQNTPAIIIAHRGASGYRLEHTLAAYELGIALGADYIELDLVPTKDGVLIARHENEISETTDVANHAEFAHRQTTKIIDGESKTGWFTEDFTLAEIKTLRAKERIPQLRRRSPPQASQNTTYDGLLEIPTLQEIIDLVKVKSAEINREIGIYPETKHPTYFQSIGLALEAPLLATLTANGYQGANAPVFIQSFEVGNLQDLSTKTDLPLVQLLNDSGKPYDFVVSGCVGVGVASRREARRRHRTYADLATASGLEEISKYAQAVGIHKNLLVPRDSNGKLQSPTSLVTDAHAAGLLVHVWTFRNEDCFLPLDFQGNPQGEYELFFSLGIDGVFTDYPDTAFAVTEKLRSKLGSP